ncbi:MAG: phosphoadenosine phosphosulfate reductase [Albidovulum sp.]|uniref:phosphoadenosine phosphosulfate reductase n=1 Tax=Albidovulum sp. TaxID=1872424 RepID=UPI003C8ABE56
MQGDGTHTSGPRSGSHAEWFDRVRQIGESGGFFKRLGAAHAALFHDDGPTLLVTFETVTDIRTQQADELPLGYHVARDRGWSHLCVIAAEDTWYRDPAVYRLFDRLDDGDFFDQFDQVVFYGAGMAGYAAAAFSVTAPGATVVVAQPQATLDPRRAGWDPRFTDMRRTSFTDRYGFAPDMVEGARSVYVLYDPEQNLDSMHASLFARPHVTLLPCRNLGRDIGTALMEMRILPSVLSAACTSTFDERLFRIFYRARRNYRPYLENLAARLISDGRLYLAALLSRNVANRLNAADFRKRTSQLEQDLAVMGKRLPPVPHK